MSIICLPRIPTLSHCGAIIKHNETVKLHSKHKTRGSGGGDMNNKEKRFVGFGGREGVSCAGCTEKREQRPKSGENNMGEWYAYPYHTSSLLFQQCYSFIHHYPQVPQMITDPVTLEKGHVVTIESYSCTLKRLALPHPIAEHWWIGEAIWASSW